MSDTPIRIFIGTDPSQELAAQVFEYSVRRHSDAEVVFDRMMGVHWPLPRDPRNYPGTNFTFNRFAIPKLAGHQGKALYVDADMLVLRDIRGLWNIPFDGATVLCAPSSAPGKRKRQLSVMLLDCDRLRWDVQEIITEGLDGGRYRYPDLIDDLCIEAPGDVREAIPPEWNSLEHYEPGRTGLLHYTHLTTQPWLSSRNRHGWLWLDYLDDALRDGAVTRAEVEGAVAQGYARPSLLRQLDQPRALRRAHGLTMARYLDRHFEPHEDLRSRQLQARRKAALAQDTASPTAVGGSAAS